VTTAVSPRVVRSRTAILRAALEELAEVGYGSFAIESVAARAHVGKSTIYRHWNDKLDLIADAFENAHEHMVPLADSGSARDRLSLLIQHVAEVVVDSMFSRSIPALIEGAERDARLRDFQSRYSAIRRRSLLELIAEGMESGEFGPTVDAELAITALLGAVFYGRLMTGSPFDPLRARELVDLVLPPPPELTMP
jgi:TetR/AcrR family transcriptional regulator, regulator of autoinduction and epiphytic fitness